MDFNNIIPTVNTIYDFFDDGKISHSRYDRIRITHVIPFNETPPKLKEYWLEEKKECSYLYNDKTDFIIKGITVSNNNTEPIGHIFTRCVNGGWFSLGYWGGRLDINGSMVATLNNYTSTLSKTYICEQIHKLGFSLSHTSTYYNKYTNNDYSIVIGNDNAKIIKNDTNEVVYYTYDNILEWAQIESRKNKINNIVSKI